MLNRLHLLAGLLALGFAASASAAPLTYNFGNSTQLSGDVVINNNSVVSGDFTFTSGNKTFTFDEASDFSTVNLTGGVILTQFSNSDGDVFELNLKLPAINGDEYLVCSTATVCRSIIGTSLSSYIDPAGLRNPPITVAAGDVALAPEPSSFVLLGTGILGVAGAVRRRYLHA